MFPFPPIIQVWDKSLFTGIFHENTRSKAPRYHLLSHKLRVDMAILVCCNAFSRTNPPRYCNCLDRRLWTSHRGNPDSNSAKWSKTANVIQTYSNYASLFDLDLWYFGIALSGWKYSWL